MYCAERIAFAPLRNGSLVVANRAVTRQHYPAATQRLVVRRQDSTARCFQQDAHHALASTPAEVAPPSLIPTADTEDAASRLDVVSHLSDAFEELLATCPSATHSKVRTAEYVQSCVDWRKCPPIRYPEFAVIGRSNVGKSSVINFVTGKEELALTSKQPGKTRCINHFLINGNSSNPWYLVDLPGYGYAKRGKAERQDFEDFTRGFFLNRSSLGMVFLLVDASIAPQQVDLDYAQWLAAHDVSFVVVFTKIDKNKKRSDGHAPVEENIAAFQQSLVQTIGRVPPCLETSARLGIGRVPLLNLIARLRAAKEPELQGEQVVESRNKRQFEQLQRYEEAKRRQAAAAAAEQQLEGARSTPAMVAPAAGGSSREPRPNTLKTASKPRQAVGSGPTAAGKGKAAGERQTQPNRSRAAKLAPSSRSARGGPKLASNRGRQ